MKFIIKKNVRLSVTLLSKHSCTNSLLITFMLKNSYTTHFYQNNNTHKFQILQGNPYDTALQILVLKFDKFYVIFILKSFLSEVRTNGGVTRSNHTTGVIMPKLFN